MSEAQNNPEFVLLKMEGVGYRSVLTDRGEYVTFKDGYLKLYEHTLSPEGHDWLMKNAKSYNITEASEEERANLVAFEESQQVRANRNAAGRELVNAILSGTDPDVPGADGKSIADQLAEQTKLREEAEAEAARKLQAAVGAGTSAQGLSPIQQKIAEAKAAQGKK